MSIAKHTYTKMNQDISKSKFSPEIYYEGRNIRIVTNEAFGSITNAKGNELKATIPDILSNPTLTKTHLDSLPYPLSNPTIVGHTSINEDLYVLSNYAIENPFAKLFYSQIQSGGEPGEPYIDSNIRVVIDGDFGNAFFNFDDTNGVIEGPELPTGTPVSITAFAFGDEPNEPAPNPTIYLEVFKNGELIFRENKPVDYNAGAVTDITFNLEVGFNSVYFFYAYSLAEPGSLPNPFTNINIFDFIIEEDIFTIHKVDKDFNVELKFIDTYDIGMTKVDVQGFYENELNQKLYWANGKDPISFINIADPDAIELDRKFLSTVPNVTLSQPEITGYSTSGSHTAGSIQYGYNLYKVNGAQTKISPVSNIVYLNNGDIGNDVNVRVSKSPKILIEDIDTSFDRIRVYSVKYTSLNSTPEIKIIFEGNTVDTLELIDDNNTNLATISFPEFLFLGGDEYIPKHLFIKDSRLFLANYKTQQLNIDFDARAYRFDKDGNTVITDNTRADITSTNFTPPSEVPEDFDAVNPTNKADEDSADWNKYIWKSREEDTIETVAATFENIFTSLVSTEVTRFENRFFNANDVDATGLDPIAYETLIIKTETIYNINPLFTLVSRTIDGANVDLAIESSCNTIGGNSEEYEWYVNLDIANSIVTFKTQYIFDSRCSAPFPTVKPVTITLDYQGTEYTISFDLRYNTVNSEAATVVIENFDNGELEFEQIILGQGVLGGIGPNVEYSIKYKTVTSNVGQIAMSSEPSLATENIPSEFTSLKSGEVYRLFLEFQLNNSGYLFPKWIGDVKIPEIGSEGSLPPVDVNANINYCYIETELLNIPQDPRITGWRVSIVERTEFDKNVITQGIFNPAIANNFNQTVDSIPSYVQRVVSRDFSANSNATEIRKPKRFNPLDTAQLNLSSNNNTDHEITAKTNDYQISLFDGSIYTPETIAEKRLSTTAAKVRVTGLVKNTFSTSHREVYDNNGLVVNTLDGITGTDLSRSVTEGGARLLMNLVTSNINKRAKLGKFISDNKDGSEELYSKKRHAFVRYFGGYSYLYIPNQAVNYYDASNTFRYTAPIVNVYNINQFTGPGFTSSFSPNGIIRVEPEDGNLVEAGIDYFQGSAITLSGIPFDFVSLSNIINFSDTQDYGVMMELYRIVDNQYGGDNYNARQLNRTIPYSKLQPLTETTSTGHTGDTFIQKFNFLKTFTTGVNSTVQIAEIVSIPVETSINLDLRWDILKNRSNNFEADENTSYGFNRVYDQQNNTIKGIPKPFNFTEINEFPVNIIPSKLKTPGELIDNFTDFLVNDIKTLDGKYGEITGVGEHSDNVFAFQRKAVAYLSINPRVQIQSNDTIPIELGSGGILERYQYLTTSSGTLNKWSIVKTNNGLMYVDLLNKSINFIGADNNKMSTVNGIYNKLFDYVDTHFEDLKVDNPVENKGIITFYDNLKEEAYFTFLTSNPFTISYNGLAQGFVSLYDFFPNHYMVVDSKMITTNDNRQMWQHNTPDSLYNTFYGQYFPSHVTVISNQDPEFNKIFDNLHFNSEFYDQSTLQDIPNITFNSLQLYSEYQNTGKVILDPTDYRSLSKRRFRKWNFIVPRNLNSRDRLFNPWMFIKLEFDKRELPSPLNSKDIRLVLHDLLVSSTLKA